MKKKLLILMAALMVLAGVLSVAFAMEVKPSSSPKPVCASDTHLWSTTGTVISTPTCTEKGAICYTCTRPGCDAYRIEETPALGHRYPLSGVEYRLPDDADKFTEANVTGNKGMTNTGFVAAPAQCEQGGTLCVYCGYCSHYETISTPSKGHVFDPTHSITTESTCIKYGSTKRICTVCGKTVDSKLPLARHIWVLNDGSEWFPLGTNMAYKKCKVCGQYEVYADYNTGSPYLVGITKGSPAENIGTLTDNNPSVTQPNKDNVKVPTVASKKQASSKKVSTEAAKVSAASVKANDSGVSIPNTADNTSTLPYFLMGIALICLAGVLSKVEKHS